MSSTVLDDADPLRDTDAYVSQQCADGDRLNPTNRKGPAWCSGWQMSEVESMETGVAVENSSEPIGKIASFPKQTLVMTRVERMSDLDNGPKGIGHFRDLAVVVFRQRSVQALLVVI